jgi:hypothetical protein
MFFGQMRFLITIGLIFVFADIFACSCGHVGIVKNKRGMTYVFKGRVNKVNEVVTYDTITGTSQKIEYRRTIYTFKIEKNYKGLKDKKTIELVTSQMTDCGVSFDKDETYIVYAYNDHRKLHYRLTDQKIEPFTTTHLCTRTKKTNALTFWEAFVLRFT